MTLNRVMVVVLRYVTKFGTFWANYVKMVEVRPMHCCENAPQRICLWKYMILIDLW